MLSGGGSGEKRTDLDQLNGLSIAAEKACGNDQQAPACHTLVSIHAYKQQVAQFIDHLLNLVDNFMLK